MLLDQDMANQKKTVESCIYRSRKAPLSKPRLVRLSGQAYPKKISQSREQLASQGSYSRRSDKEKHWERARKPQSVDIIIHVPLTRPVPF